MMDRDFPRISWNAKKNLNKKVSKSFRFLRNSLKENGFSDRYDIILKNKYFYEFNDASGIEMCIEVEFVDRKHPERNMTQYYKDSEVIYSGFFCGGKHLDKDINNFIVFE